MRVRPLSMLLLPLALVAAAGASAADERPRTQTRLQQVRKIYVGDMGRAGEAERFRLLLGEQLARKGFTVVERAEEADAVLTGALSVRTYDEKTEARVFVKLETPNGVRLWAKDFGHKRLLLNPFDLREPTKRRAEDVASALRRDWERAK